MLIHDRYSDPEITLFENKEEAINLAKNYVKKWSGDYVDDNPYEVPEWLYYRVYSSEGDYISVLEKDLIKNKGN